MVLWRISRHRDLDGLGGLRAPGRWHERGLPVVYLAETAAGALLEVCVHTAANDVPPSYTLLEVTVPTTTMLEAISVDSLPQDWRGGSGGDSRHWLGMAALNALGVAACS